MQILLYVIDSRVPRLSFKIDTYGGYMANTTDKLTANEWIRSNPVIPREPLVSNPIGTVKDTSQDDAHNNSLSSRTLDASDL